MMDIVTGRSRESPLGFRANPQIRGTARRPYKRMTASEHNGMAPPKTTAMRRRRIHAEYAVITALISTASSVVCAAQLPVTTWPRPEWVHAVANEPMHQVTVAEPDEQGRSESGAHGAALAALIRPAPAGEITPDPPIPAPTAEPIAPPVTAPPARAQQPLSPPRQPAAPAPQPEAPAPQPEAPGPGPEAPPPQPPPRGHVQLAP
jgi:hypothetical protein